MRRDRFVTAGGSSVYLEDSGGRIPVLALHGLGGGAFFFRTLAAPLAPACRLLALDLPGVGWSTSEPRAFTLDSWMADLGDLVTSHIGEPVVILGHSLGTILALEAWRRWPAHVRAIICVGGLPEVRPAIRERLSSRLTDVRAHGLGGWAAKAMPGIFALQSFDRRAAVVAMYERLFEAQESGVYTRCIEILLSANASDVVNTVTVPCLAVTGAGDQYAPPDLVEAFTARLAGPHHTLVIPECGHLPFFEAPEAFAEALQSFLETLSEGRKG
jgi:3-oxoadipate enol-lactonase